jgi:hypothetical protein
MQSAIDNLSEKMFGRTSADSVCVTCGSDKISPEDFVDDLSFKEFSISHMCQDCQDGVFGKPKKKPVKKETQIGPNDIIVGGRYYRVKTVRPENYKRYEGTSGRTWIVGNCEEAGQHIYVSADTKENAPGYRGFRGFGGSTLSFNLEDGEIVQLQGPWHSNSEALYSDTGIDVRDKFYTWGCVSEEREWKNHDTIMKGVIYKDDSPVLGDYYRVTRIAMDIAKKLNKTIYCYSESAGGSSCGCIYPDQIDVHGNRAKENNI